jgi:CDP-paratose 2-epimerase
MRVLITGGCGFLGANVAHGLVTDGCQVITFDNLSRRGAVQNLDWLRAAGQQQFIHGDIRLRQDVDRAVRLAEPDAVLHFAGQVAMAASLLDPRTDFEINALGTLNLLEAGCALARATGRRLPFIYASTNKVYGDLESIRHEEDSTRYRAVDYPNGFPESMQLDFRTPYGCSKGAADQMVLDYSRRGVGLSCSVFRHSSMYGPRQFATETQGWIGWFCSRAILAKSGRCRPFSVSGNGKQVRDLLHSEDMVHLYTSALRNPDAVAGKAYNVGGGPENAMSILELLAWLESATGTRLDWHSAEQRVSDQKVFVADCTRIRADLGWEPQVTRDRGLQSMVAWCESLMGRDD